jgi:hypothetical protein
MLFSSNSFYSPPEYEHFLQVDFNRFDLTGIKAPPLGEVTWPVNISIF